MGRMTKRPARRVTKPDPVMQAYARALRASRWQRRNAQMWAQAQRLGKLIAIQQGTQGREFPAGCCFLHAGLPSVSSFCVRRVVEVDLDDLPAVLERREAILAAVHGAGYRYVTLDLDGFRSGNLNG